METNKVEIANNVVKRYEAAKGKRADDESRWNDIDPHVDVRKSDNKILTSVGYRHVLRIQAGLQSILAPMGTKWHSLTTGIEELDNEISINEYLAHIESELYKQRGEGSNFYNNLLNVYGSLAKYGNACLYVFWEDKTKRIIYQFIPVREIYIEENYKREVDAVFRVYKLTAKQAVQAFGLDKVSDKIKKEFENVESTEEFEILHAVCSRVERNDKAKDALNMPFASYHIEIDSKTTLSSSGYNSLPYIYTRLHTDGTSIYGVGIAEMAKPDFKQFNKIEETILIAMEKLANPPMITADRDASLLDLRAGAINYGFMTQDGTRLVEPLHTVGDISRLEQEKSEKLDAIHEIFYIDAVNMLEDHPNQTATEVLTRKQAKGVILAPLMSGQQNQLLEPLISREFDLLQENNILQPLSDEAKNKIHEYYKRDNSELNKSILESDANLPINIVYETPLAKLIQSEEAMGMVNALQVLAPLQEINPNLFKVINWDKANRELILTLGIPGRLLYSETEIKEQQELEAQQAQMQEQAQAMEQMANMAPNITGAMKDISDIEQQGGLEMPEMSGDMGGEAGGAGLEDLLNMGQGG